ncbi:MAG: sulfotransferase domain-containing protein [Magnetococcales bacterium]|nr:sulfotransferase domain-containing protein [Magnetococcales bacterium]
MKANLFIVGSAKSGTTSLFYELMASQEIRVPDHKEQNFFSKGCANVPGNGPGDKLATYVAASLEAYESSFTESGSDDQSKQAHYYCDASVAYLYDDQAPALIHAYNPDARIIIMLRNPVDRAWSHYRHLKRDCREKETFDHALDKELQRMQDGWEFSWHYVQMGMYSQQVQRYLQIFGHQQVKVVFLDDYRVDSLKVVQDVLRFLELDITLPKREKSQHHNASGEARWPLVSYIFNRPSRLRNFVRDILPRPFAHAVMERIRSFNNKPVKPKMMPETRSRLIEIFKEDIQQLGKMLQRDLSHWIQDDHSQR